MINLLSFLQGTSGKTSSMRVATMLIVVSVMAVWVKISWVENKMMPVDGEMVVLVLGALGLKAAQRYGEKTPSSVNECLTPPK